MSESKRKKNDEYLTNFTNSHYESITDLSLRIGLNRPSKLTLITKGDIP